VVEIVAVEIVNVHPEGRARRHERIVILSSKNTVTLLPLTW